MACDRSVLAGRESCCLNLKKKNNIQLTTQQLNGADSRRHGLQLKVWKRGKYRVRNYGLNRLVIPVLYGILGAEHPQGE